MFYNFFKHFRENQFQAGCRDRDAGLLPTKQDPSYLDGYLSDRPRGFDDEIQYFPSVQAYLQWKGKSPSA